MISSRFARRDTHRRVRLQSGCASDDTAVVPPGESDVPNAKLREALDPLGRKHPLSCPPPSRGASVNPRVESGIHMRSLGVVDLPFAVELKEAASWSQTLDDWRVMSGIVSSFSGPGVGSSAEASALALLGGDHWIAVVEAILSATARPRGARNPASRYASRRRG